MVRKNAAAADKDPIMYEVDDDSGNKPNGKPSKKKDKGKDLLNKFSGGDGEEEGASSARKPRELTAKQQKAKDQKEYGLSDSSEEEEGTFVNSQVARAKAKKNKGISWTHIFVLIMMVAGGAAPMLMMFGDKLSQLTSTFIPDLNIKPTLASMGLSNTPKARMKLFYEKHNPEKMNEIDVILKKYAGDYKAMTRKLESKYQDHGFFIGWEQDGGLADAQAKTYKFVKEVGGKYYQKYVPWQLRQGILTIYTKGMYYYKKAYKQVDKWTTPAKPKSGAGSKSSSSSKGKSRRERNSQARD